MCLSSIAACNYQDKPNGPGSWSRAGHTEICMLWNLEVEKVLKVKFKSKKKGLGWSEKTKISLGASVILVLFQHFWFVLNCPSYLYEGLIETCIFFSFLLLIFFMTVTELLCWSSLLSIYSILYSYVSLASSSVKSLNITSKRVVNLSLTQHNHKQNETILSR